ncbi:response regulator receiver domain [Flavobacterium columnare]|uniref:response regulator receiver domain n=1 Tax=Flavobacterium columnare TaxID=996 RepID=UPI0018C8ABF0|nr:response regulator receiver domain [Flavobacterium columnare]
MKYLQSLLEKEALLPLELYKINPIIMSNPFFEKSREIANNFLQSIVFIDDKAYSGVTEDDPNHDFDAQKVSMAFAKEKKVCGVYQPKTKEDIENFKSIIKKADVVILDWKIILSENDIEDLEEDDVDDDPRGVYTLDILRNITQDNTQNNESLKLIIVYTGETDLIGITNQIFKELQAIKSDLSEKSCEVSSDNIKILIRGKSSVDDDEIDNKFNHIQGLNDKIIKYKDLPNFVLDEFTLMTSGLLSNFALLSLIILRQNSSKLLALFSKKMDSAYLSHKILLTNQDDAESLLIELFGDSIIDLLFYHKIGGYLDKELINDWIDENIIDEKFDVADKSFTRTKKMIIGLLESNEIDINKRILNSFEGNGNLTNKQKESFIINSTRLFLSNEHQNNSTKINLEFAKLTHHKSLFLPNNVEPKLTLGTIIKSNKKEVYYICIQQKCDSVRLKINEERKFLFLPFTSTTDDKFDILTHDEVKLKQEKKSFSIRTIIFICNNYDGVIKGVKNDSEKYIFNQKYTSEADEQFEWVLDLKDLHSQRIVAEYSSNLSRVGLDESEFLRRSSLLK